MMTLSVFHLIHLITTLDTDTSWDKSPQRLSCDKTPNLHLVFSLLSFRPQQRIRIRLFQQPRRGDQSRNRDERSYHCGQAPLRRPRSKERRSQGSFGKPVHAEGGRHEDATDGTGKESETHNSAAFLSFFNDDRYPCFTWLRMTTILDADSATTNLLCLLFSVITI